MLNITSSKYFKTIKTTESVQGHFHFAGGKGPEVPGPTSQPGQECAWHTAVSPQVAQAQGGPLQQRAMPRLTG